MEEDRLEPQRAAASSIGTIGFGTHRYKAAFSHVAPASAAAAEHGGEKCMLGVSLGSANFEGARLEASIEWISERFERCAITIGDSVYRLTLQLLHGLSEDEARAQALAAGQAFARTYAPLIRQYGAKCQFEYILFSDVAEQSGFPAHLAALERLAIEDVGFAHSIDAFADLYLGRGDKLDQNPFAVPEEQAKAIAKAYLIEESALFCCLEEMGWPLLVYPGSIASIADLCEGRFAGAPVALTRLAFASLSLRKRGLFFADGAFKVMRGSGDHLAESAESFLADVDDAGWNQLLRIAKIKKFAPREAILNADDPSRQFFMLFEGRAEVSVKRPDGTRQQIAIIEKGSVFGEQAFLDGLPRSATVTALNDCVARSLSWKDFAQLRATTPDLACSMLVDIGRVLSLRGRRQLRELQHLP